MNTTTINAVYTLSLLRRQTPIVVSAKSQSCIFINLIQQLL